MENNTEEAVQSPPEKKSSGCLRVLAVAGLFLLTSALFAGMWVKYNLYASQFTPVHLTAPEQKILDTKLAVIEHPELRHRAAEKARAGKPLKAEPYSEIGLKREISLTEKELNSLIGNTPEAAERVAIDLSDNLISVKLVIPVDDDVIVLGGKTIRLNLGMILGYENGRPIVALKGVTMGGVPLPNAWLGYMKDKNLVEEFGSETGFWKLFSEGVEDIRVKNGHLLVRLKE